MSCQIIRASDLRPFLPVQDATDEQLRLLVDDANALIAYHVPCLADADEALTGAARATIRASLRVTIASGGADQTDESAGPFKRTRKYGSGGSAADVVTDRLIDQLRKLCDPSYGSKVAIVDLSYVPHIPDSGDHIPYLEGWA